jgi:hypothetical protein
MRLSQLPVTTMFVLFVMAFGASASTVEILGEAPTPSGQPPPDRSLVYFLGPGDVFVDDQAVASLRRKGYVAVLAEPGRRLLWSQHGANTKIASAWFELRAGASYLFQLPTLRLDDAADIEQFREQRKLRYRANPEAFSKHRLVIGYQEARQGAEADAVSGTLPQDLDRITYAVPQERKRGFKGMFKAVFLPDKGQRGSLSVDTSELRFSSRDQTVRIAVSEILRVEPFVVHNRSGEPALFLYVRHGPEEAAREAYFKAPADHGLVPTTWNRLYTAVGAALAEASAGKKKKRVPPLPEAAPSISAFEVNFTPADSEEYTPTDVSSVKRFKTIARSPGEPDWTSDVEEPSRPYVLVGRLEIPIAWHWLEKEVSSCPGHDGLVTHHVRAVGGDAILLCEVFELARGVLQNPDTGAFTTVSYRELKLEVIRYTDR